MDYTTDVASRSKPSLGSQLMLFVVPLPPPTTGQSLACQAIYDDLLMRGFQLHLVNLSKSSFKQGINSFGRMLEIARVLLQTLRGSAGVQKVYFTPAESVAGNLKDLLIYLALGRRLGVTYIHLHGGAGMRVLLSDAHPWLRSLNGLFLRRMAGVIVLGDRHVQIYDGLVESDRIHVVKNFAPDEMFIDDLALQQKLANTEPIRVLFLSNLLPGKGFQELLSAIDMLAPVHRARFAFDFAGGFESQEAQKTFLESIRQLDGVAYHGTVYGEKKRALLHQAHIFCLPTYYPYEGQPISILEAYAAGCAVITTDHSGIFDIFTPGKHGVAVDKKSPQSIMRALESLATNYEVLRTFALSNARVARTQYRKDQHLARLRYSLGLS